MKKEAYKSVWYNLLLKAHKRAKSSNELAKVLDVSVHTVKAWMSRPTSLPRTADKLIPIIEEYLSIPFTSAPNPVARERMWQSMRCLSTFSTAEIMATADTCKQSTQKFLTALRKAGYVRIHNKGWKRVWHLVFNTGPKAPELSRDRNSVYDPNLKREVWRKEAKAA